MCYHSSWVNGSPAEAKAEEVSWSFVNWLFLRKPVKSLLLPFVNFAEYHASLTGHLKQAFLDVFTGNCVLDSAETLRVFFEFLPAAKRQVIG